MKHKLEVLQSSPGGRVSRSAMRYFAGTSTPVHRHSGVVLAYVLEGRARFGINDEPEQVISAGGTFFEPLGAVQTGSIAFLVVVAQHTCIAL